MEEARSSKTGKNPLTDQQWPSVSVVIPVRNGAATIRRSISSAQNQEYPSLLEIIVADGKSTDATSEILTNMAANDHRIRVVDNPAGTTPSGLNKAIRSSSGDVVVRLDAQSVLPPGYFKRAIRTLLSTQADNVGGIQAATGDSFVQRSIALAMSTPLGVGNARFHTGGRPGPTDTVYLGVFRRDVFNRVGYFDETLLRNQDYELNYRIRSAGGTVWFDPGLKVEYRPRDSIIGLWKQYSQYGAWKRTVMRRHPGSIRLRQAAPPILVLGLLASLAMLATSVPIVGMIIPLLYMSSVTLAAIAIAVRRRSLPALLLPVVLPTMHLAWGTGFLIGGPVRSGSFVS